MKTLIKIRAMYLKKHPCELCLSYLCVGVLMFIVGLIIVYEEIKSDLRRQKMEIYEQKYSNQIDKTKSYLFNIGLISEDNQIINHSNNFQNLIII